jgi:hypothetical protein
MGEDLPQDCRINSASDTRAHRRSRYRYCRLPAPFWPLLAAQMPPPRHLHAALPRRTSVEQWPRPRSRPAQMPTGRRQHASAPAGAASTTGRGSRRAGGPPPKPSPPVESCRPGSGPSLPQSSAAAASLRLSARSADTCYAGDRLDHSHQDSHLPLRHPRAQSQRAVLRPYSALIPGGQLTAVTVRREAQESVDGGTALRHGLHGARPQGGRGVPFGRRVSLLWGWEVGRPVAQSGGRRYRSITGVLSVKSGLRELPPNSPRGSKRGGRTASLSERASSQCPVENQGCFEPPRCSDGNSLVIQSVNW